MTDSIPGAKRLVDEALDEGAQAIVNSAAPLARTDELVAAVQGPAVRAVLDARIRHIVKNGHTVEADVRLEPYQLLDKTVEKMRIARARVGVLDVTPESLAAARKALADGCALGLAAIDRIDAELRSGGAE